MMKAPGKHAATLNVRISMETANTTPTTAMDSTLLEFAVDLVKGSAAQKHLPASVHTSVAHCSAFYCFTQLGCRKNELNFPYSQNK